MHDTSNLVSGYVRSSDNFLSKLNRCSGVVLKQSVDPSPHPLERWAVEAHTPTSGIWGDAAHGSDPAQHLPGAWLGPSHGSVKSTGPGGGSFSRVPRGWQTWVEAGSIISTASKPPLPRRHYGLAEQSGKEQSTGKAQLHPSDVQPRLCCLRSHPAQPLHPCSQRP